MISKITAPASLIQSWIVTLPTLDRDLTYQVYNIAAYRSAAGFSNSWWRQHVQQNSNKQSYSSRINIP